MIKLAWKQFKKLFLPDIIFFMIVMLSLAFGFVLFFLSHLPPIGRVELGSLPLLTGLDIPLPSIPLPSIPMSAIFALNQHTVQWLDQPKSIFDFTDPAATYDNTGVKDLWGLSLFIADSIILVFIILAGYRILFAGFSSRYSEALEALPNFIFAAIGANISLLFARFWIDLNNLLCGLMLAQAGTESHPMSGFGAIALGAFLAIIAIPLVLVLTLLMIILGIQMAARLGIILFLTVFLPILFILLANHQTQRFGHAGLSAYVTAVLVQFIQLTCITISGKVLLPFLSENIGPAEGIAPFATIIGGIALLWITLRIPSMLRSWALQPVAESSRAALSLLFVAGAQLTR